MRTYVVIPEGLSVDEAGVFYPSDYYRAALDRVGELSIGEDRICLAPANTFGAHQPEDHFGRDYLEKKGCSAKIIVIADAVVREGYLDTLDNAVYLKRHLLNMHEWPVGEIVLVCNRPHRWRGYLMFRYCGYQVKKVIGSRPVERSGRRMVKRLWFYDVPVIQYMYEAMAIVYNTMRFLNSKNNI